jgi:Txe/YoeB family toxin of Txe-Axe toxin-antitoxin module
VRQGNSWSWEDYLYWQKIDKKKVKKINDLLKMFSRNPFEGIGNRTIETQVCWILVRKMMNID